jgi:hypothetical protein
VLGEEDGKRRLPIIIGMFEAQAIAIEIEKIVPNRPMTHDLFKSFAKEFNYTIKEIVISDLSEGVFFAKILCSDGNKEIEIDSRPSDAIAIGIRFNVPIFTYDKILEEAGVIMDEEDEISSEIREVVSTESEEQSSTSTTKGETLSGLSNDELEKKLAEALKKEDYEKAAKIRDELNRRS